MDTTVTDSPPPEPGDQPPPPLSPPTSPPASPQPSGLGAWWSSLYRSCGDRLLGGVAGGLAQRFGVPVLLVRIAFVVTAFLGFGVPLYVLGWVLLPDERGARVLGHGPVRDLVAVGAVVVAGLMLLAEVDDIAYGSLIGRSLPWFVVLAGLALLLRRHDASTPAAPAPPTPPMPGSAMTTAPMTEAGPAIVGPPRPRPLPSPPVPRAPRPRPFVGPLTWCVALLAVAALGLVELANGSEATTIGPGAMAAVVMIVFGLGLTFSAFRGRARGLILPALALAVGLGGLTALDVRADTTNGPFDLRITSESALPREIEAVGGTSILDLGDLRLTTSRSVTIRQIGGRVRVVLPRSVTGMVTVHVDSGSAYVVRPSVSAALGEQDITRNWVESGLPDAGTVLTSMELRRFAGNEWLTNYRMLDADRGTYTVDRGTDAVLRVHVELGLGDAIVVDPRWSDVPSSIVTPEQLCTVGGGPRGVVQPCSEVPDAARVALCINESAFLVDCREDRPGSIDVPRIAACRGADGQTIDCSVLGIEPVGAQLISPTDATAPTEDTIAPPDPTDAPDPIDPTVDEATNPDGTIAPQPPGTVPPPTPEATVPPVPTPGG